MRLFYFCCLLTLVSLFSFGQEIEEEVWRLPRGQKLTLRSFSSPPKQIEFPDGVFLRRKSIVESLHSQEPEEPLVKPGEWAVQIVSPPEFFSSGAELLLIQESELKAKATLLDMDTVIEMRTRVNQALETLEPSTGRDQACTALVDGRNIPAYDESWTFDRAVQFILETNLCDPKQLRIKLREEWDENYIKKIKKEIDQKIMDGKIQRMDRVDGIVVHHSAHPYSMQSPKEILEKHKKLDDIGYHFEIAEDKYGEVQVYELRKLYWEDPRKEEGKLENEKQEIKEPSKKQPIRYLVQGAHAGVSRDGKINYNVGKIGVVFSGNFQEMGWFSNWGGYTWGSPEFKRQPKPMALIRMCQLIRYLQQKPAFPIHGHYSITDIYAHGQGPLAINPGHTDCPGDGCLPVLKALRKRLFGPR